MVKTWQKQLEKFSHILWLKEIIKDILSDNISDYDVKKLSWYRDLYRLRKWKIRIIFRKNIYKIELISIDTRGDVYKWL